eukprot:5940895-Amphidinium_carterae.1
MHLLIAGLRGVHSCKVLLLQGYHCAEKRYLAKTRPGKPVVSYSKASPKAMRTRHITGNGAAPLHEIMRDMSAMGIMVGL